ncbi:MAG: hypothetical protein U0795_23500 [Pirellulales bacterium]
MSWRSFVPVVALVAVAASIGSKAMGQFEENDLLPDLEGEWAVKSITESREPLCLPELRPAGSDGPLSLHFLKDVCEVWQDNKRTTSKRVYVGQLTMPYSPLRSFFYEVDGREGIFRKGLIAVEGDSMSLGSHYGDTLLPKPFVPKHRHVDFSCAFERAANRQTSTTRRHLSRQDICGNWKIRGEDVLLALEPISLAFVSTVGRREVSYEFCPGETTSSIFCRLAGDEPLYVRLASEVSKDGDEMAIHLAPKVSAWLSGILPEKLREEETLLLRRTE